MLDPLDRLPPQSIDTERQIIGAILLDPRQLDRVASKLTPDDFYADAHKKLFGHFVAMSDNGQRIDATTLIDRIKRSADLEAIGGGAYIAECAQSVAVAANAPHYAKIVHRHSQLRKIIAAGTDLIRAGYDDLDPEQALATAEAALAGIKTGQGDSDPVSLRDATVLALAAIDKQIERGKGAGIMTGLERFDNVVGGFFPSELTILAARPSQGKTSLSVQIAAHMAGRGRRVYFASLEMDQISVATKRLCTLAGVPQQSIRSNSIGPDEVKRLVAASHDTPGTLFVHDRPRMRPYDIARAARQLHAEIVFVDYLQIVTPPDHKKNRYEQVGEITLQLRAIAREQKIPVVACAQIKRADNKGQTSTVSRPRMDQLRESGNIEQDTDVILLLWRPEGGIHSDSDAWAAEIEVAKNRLGVTEKFRLDWDPGRTLFSIHGSPIHEEFSPWQ